MPRPPIAHFLSIALCAALSLSLPAIADDSGRVDRLTASALALAEALSRLDADDGTSERAMALLSRARAAKAAGQPAEAQALAATAYRSLRDRIRSVSAGRNTAISQPPEPPAAASPAFVAQRRAALELRGAALRVAEEKRATTGFIAAFDRDVATADALARDSRHDEASATLQRAYDGIKGTLVSLRNGDTLVRSLSFASPQDEFRYEQDRNDTFAMLVPLLASEALTSPRIEGFLAAAKALRAEAEAAGASGNFESGIALLDRSSHEYRKVIRNAGVLLPG
ncbi:MAG: hypothetical protein KDH20_00195 [Rhodocyclaceae bacterium]|nr:hypothetical protein [Rhodocyclaceae bacterium]